MLCDGHRIASAMGPEGPAVAFWPAGKYYSIKNGLVVDRRGSVGVDLDSLCIVGGI